MIARDTGYPVDDVIVRATVLRQPYIHDLANLRADILAESSKAVGVETVNG